MPQIYDMGPTALLPLWRKVCWGFFHPKNPTASAGFEPANLGTKGQHATPRPPKPQDLAQGNKNWERNRTQNDKRAEVYPLLGCCMVVGGSFWCDGKMHQTQVQRSSSPIKNATMVSILGLCHWLLGGREVVPITGVVEGLKGPLQILVVARWWRPNVSAGAYWEVAQGQWEKKGGVWAFYQYFSHKKQFLVRCTSVVCPSKCTLWCIPSFWQQKIVCYTYSWTQLYFTQ